jgi:endogenous inhibitor of DNA gyrase (YacG/DUF329 family)
MPEYLIAKCPYCGYHWRVRNVSTEEFKRSKESVIGLPVSCPKCKKRFDADWSKKATFVIGKHKNFKELRKALTKYNRNLTSSQ